MPVRIEDERQEFCRQLKLIRERKRVSLEQIAEATKIRASLFADFERNDLKHWPQGVYRRSYFRDYAKMLDVPLDDTCAEFKRLFASEPSGDAPPPSDAAATPAPSVAAPVAAAPAGDLRLELDTAWHGPRAPVLSRLLAAVIDGGLIALVSGAMMLVAGLDAAVSVAAVTLAYFSLGTVLFGESPAKWMLARRESIAAVFAPPAPAAPPEPDESRPWVSDATRVGPAPPPQLRVRFKL